MLTLKWESKPTPVNEPCLVFGFNDPASLFKGEFYLDAYVIGNSFVCNHNLAIYGIDLDRVGDQWPPVADRKYLRKGRLVDGTARYVYPVINDPALPFRAGLTIHAAKGTWSSLPHKFEAEEILDPRPMPFYEKFAYVTEQPGGWGVQMRIGHLYFGNRVTEDEGYWWAGPDGDSTRQWINDAVVIRDRDILDIPLGSHPVVSCPGNRLGYFWCYWTSESTPWVMSMREKY